MRWTARGILWWMIQPHLENYWFCPGPNRRWWWHRGESITGQEAASGTQRANVCPFPFVITAVRAMRGTRECGIAARSCPLQPQVEMGLLSINLNRRRGKKKKKGPKGALALPRPLAWGISTSNAGRNKAKGNKAAVCPQSRSPLSSSEAALCQLGAKDDDPAINASSGGSSEFVNKQAPLLMEHNALLFTVQPQHCLSQPLQSVEWKLNHKRLDGGVFIQTRESAFSWRKRNILLILFDAATERIWFDTSVCYCWINILLLFNYV